MRDVEVLSRNGNKITLSKLIAITYSHNYDLDLTSQFDASRH